MNAIFTCVYDIFSKHFIKVAISQVVMWSISTAISNPTLVDVAWGLNHVIVGVGVLSMNYPKLSYPSIIGSSLLFLWFFRLSGFIFYNRIYKKYVDPRYEKLAQKRNINKTAFYFIQFQLQGVLSVLTSIPLYFALSSVRSLSMVNYMFAAFAAIGIIGEAIADQQLQNFKSNRKEGEQLFREGLFKKARHPNLFFELVFWVGIAGFAYNPSNIGSLFAFVGPAMLWAIMYYLTIPVTTKHMMRTKTNYDQVIRETNMFFPF
jgi:steroid 5-alpha reductase family enzyme